MFLFFTSQFLPGSSLQRLRHLPSLPLQRAFRPSPVAGRRGKFSGASEQQVAPPLRALELHLPPPLLVSRFGLGFDLKLVKLRCSDLFVSPELRISNDPFSELSCFGRGLGQLRICSCACSFRAGSHEFIDCFSGFVLA